MQRFPYDEVDVLVVGGGAAGLTTGLVLGELGIPTLVIERRPDASSHPRATALTRATMNLIRDWGIEPQVRQAGFAALPMMSLRPVLVGPELDRLPLPEQVLACAQDRLEPILCARARSFGTRVVYGWEVTQVQVGEDGVQVTVREPSTGATSVVRARFLVGADGASSRVRHAVGIRLTRSHSYGDWISMLFQSPLREYSGDPPYMVYGIANTDPVGVLVPTDATDRWIRGIPWHPEAGERLEDYDGASCTALIRSAVGIPTLPVSLLAVQAFGMAAALADRYRVDRVLLVGDSAHIFPPASGMGLNTAIQDAVVGARCLAQALQNSDAGEVLNAYEAERRPVAEQLLAPDLAAQ